MMTSKSGPNFITFEYILASKLTQIFVLKFILNKKQRAFNSTLQEEQDVVPAIDCSLWSSPGSVNWKPVFRETWDEQKMLLPLKAYEQVD